MNDDEVLTEMKKMVAFIKQEAMEKAREIQVKADEEFAIEKVSRNASGRKACGAFEVARWAYFLFSIRLMGPWGLNDVDFDAIGKDCPTRGTEYRVNVREEEEAGKRGSEDVRRALFTRSLHPPFLGAELILMLILLPADN